MGKQASIVVRTLSLIPVFHPFFSFFFLFLFFSFYTIRPTNNVGTTDMTQPEIRIFP